MTLGILTSTTQKTNTNIYANVRKSIIETVFNTVYDRTSLTEAFRGFP